MLAGQDDASIDLAEIVVVLFSRLVRPVPGTPQREGRAMPGDGNAVLELRLVLRMDLGAVVDCAPHALLRRHGREFVGIRSIPGIAAQQNTLAGRVVVSAGIGNLPDRQIGVADAAEDDVVLLPEPALELQADLDRGSVGHGTDRGFHGVADLNIDLAQDSERNGAYAPV